MFYFFDSFLSQSSSLFSIDLQFSTFMFFVILTIN